VPRRSARPPIWKPALGYGMLLAAGTFALQWLDYQRMLRSNIEDIAIFLIVGFFLAVGVVVGIRLFAPRAALPDGNPQAIAALGISNRELAVLRELAAGASNKEIADRLGVSPNTIKTHIAKLFEKLGASRRTDAIARARELGILS
jgi:DNA-binding CsgD family transcriptional regulator